MLLALKDKLIRGLSLTKVALSFQHFLNAYKLTYVDLFIYHVNCLDIL